MAHRAAYNNRRLRLGVKRGVRTFQTGHGTRFSSVACPSRIAVHLFITGFSVTHYRPGGHRWRSHRLKRAAFASADDLPGNATYT